jgi:replicative DNA helicase
MTTIGAYTGVGKSFLGMQIAESASVGGTVLFVSAEMKNEEHAERGVTRRTGMALDRVQRRGFNDDERVAYHDALADWTESRVLTIDDGDFDIDKTLRSANDIADLVLLVVDYVQMLGGGTGSQKQERVAEVSRKLKVFGMMRCIPILVLAQFNRNRDQRTDKRPVLADIRDSAQIAADSSLVLLLHRDKDNTPREADIFIAKGRSGAGGVVKLGFDTTRLEFTAPPIAF